MTVGHEVNKKTLPKTAVDTPLRRVSPWQRRITKLTASSSLYMAVVLLGLIITFSILSPEAFPTAANSRNIVNDAASLLVMAVGITFVMVSAGIDLSIGSVLVFSSVIASKVMTAAGGQGWGTVLLGLIAAILAGAAWGGINAFAVTVLRVPSLITTLGTTGAALGLSRVLTNGNDLRGIPPELLAVSTGRFLGLSWLVWIAVATVIIGGFVLSFTRFGRHTYIIGSNEQAAARSGINVRYHLVKLYLLSGTLAGVAGMMALTRFTTTTIGGHTQDSLNVITGVVLGGTSLFGGIGSIVGSVIGIFIPAVLQNGLVVQQVPSFWQEVAIGFVLIIAVFIDQLKRRQRDKI